MPLSVPLQGDKEEEKTNKVKVKRAKQQKKQPTAEKERNREERVILSTKKQEKWRD